MKISLFPFSSGRESDFKKVFEDLYPKLCGFANKYLNDICASEDLVQDVFSDLWYRRKHIQIKSSFKSLLYASVKNRCISQLKKQARDKQRILDYQSLESESVFAYNMLEQETHVKIHRVIESLPKKTREIILMSMHNASNREIEEELKINVETIKYHKRKAYKTLRKKLKG